MTEKPKPLLIQIDDLIREMTPEEEAEFIANQPSKIEETE